MTKVPDPTDRQRELGCFRDGAGWPRRLLDIVQAARGTGADAVPAVAALFNGWPNDVRARLGGIRPAPDWPVGDAPHTQILQTAGTVLARLPGPWSRCIPQAAPQAWPQDAAGDLQRWRAQLLAYAVTAGRIDWNGVPPMPPGEPHCSLRILLVDNQMDDGLLGVLQLQCVHIPNAHLALVAAPGSAFTPCTASFRAALDNVTAFLREQLLPEATRDTALAWDIHLPGKPLLLLDGPSAGGAVALAALWLLQDHFKHPSQPLPRALARLDRSMLEDSGISAALATDRSGTLCPVGGIGEKARALGSVASIDRPAHLFVHPLDIAALRAELPAGLQAHKAGSLLGLVREMARAMDLSPPQKALSGAMQVAAPAAPSPGVDAPGVPTAAAQVARHPGDVRHLDAYALHVWSLWNTAGDAGAARCFVSLRLVDPREGAGGSEPGEGAQAPSPLQWLRSLPVPAAGLPPVAVLIRGGPGSGKSTWLRQLQAELCEEFVCHVASRQATGVPEPAEAELPILVPLRHLPPDQDPLDWLRARMQRLYPRCHALHSLLRGETLPGHPNLKLRFLLDGLDELRTGSVSKVQRAKEVLQVFTLGPLLQFPPVLCTRGAHTFDALLSVGVRAMDLGSWLPADVRQYVQRRLCAERVDPQPLLVALQHQPWLLSLCRTPFHAQSLCTQWIVHPSLASNRAACQRRLLHAALLRELDSETELGVVAHRNPMFQGDHSLLSPADRDALQNAGAWHPEPPAPWPPGCGLLNAAFRQALAQRLTAVQQSQPYASLPWDDHGKPDRSVVHWLPAEQRPLWRQMVHDLGLLAPGAEAGTRFAFHPDWDDHLASVDLFDQVPRRGLSLPAHERLVALQTARGFPRSDVEERDHQRLMADNIWREPDPAFWAGLFSQPLRLPRSAMLDALRAEGYTDTMLHAPTDGAGGVPAGQWQQAMRDGIVDLQPDSDHCVIDLQAWGDAEDIRSRCGLPAGDWTREPAAWRMLLQLLPAPLRDHVWSLLGPAQARRLQQHQGRLVLRTEAALDRPLAQALMALDKATAQVRVAELVKAGLWMALQPAAADLQRHLEGCPENAWTAPDPVLQHLRRVLLLHAIDAGPDAEAPVRQSGQWALIDQPIEGLPASLQDHWRLIERPAAFGRHPSGRVGRDLRDRLQAAHMLGLLGDTLRYEPAQAATGRGLRLRAGLWADVGTPGQDTTFAIGSPRGESGTGAAEQSQWPAEVPGLRVARLLVTVAEWRCFVAADGYAPGAAHWRQAGAAALHWLEGVLARHPRYQPPALDDPDWGQALNPITSITVYEAMAYAAWAAPMYADGPPGIDWPQPVLRPPNEVEWEAAQRADANGRPMRQGSRWAHRAAGAPGPMLFNHAATGWLQPSPVGVFSQACSPAGLADGCGNVWEWCVNSLPAGPTGYDSAAGRAEAQASWDAGVLPAPRAVRGGAYHAPAWDCRVANRSSANAEDGGSDIGLRLVQVWPAMRRA